MKTPKLARSASEGTKLTCPPNHYPGFFVGCVKSAAPNDGAFRKPTYLQLQSDLNRMGLPWTKRTISHGLTSRTLRIKHSVGGVYSMAITPEMFIGTATAAMCLLGLRHGRWILEETRKGRWLAGRLGDQTGLLVLRGLLIAGAIFGLALASGLVRPVRW